MNWLARFATLLVVSACSYIASAQSVTTVENYGIALATTAVNGLGTNITPNNSWEYAAAKAAGITVGRFDCGWTSVEVQNLPGNTSGGYTWPSTCSQGLSNSSTYGIHPVVDALYGATYGAILTGTTSSDSPSGSTVISITVSTGSFSYIVNQQTYLYPSGGNFYGAKNSYPGILITANDGSSTITLASALTSDMPSGTAITLNLQLYPPFLMAATGNYLTNASVVAYGNYAAYLAGKINAAGLTGQVSLWNEPPWPSDSWDYGANLFDTRPSNLWQAGNNTDTGLELPFYFANEVTAPSGVTYDNGYTEKSGTNSMFWTNYYSYLNNPSAAQAVFGSESFHPYGNNPEDSWWDPVCLAANATPANLNNIYAACTPVGAVQGSNYKIAVATSMTSYHTGGGLPHSITETGLQQSSGVTNAQVSRFELRQFIGYQALGITPIDFYRLYGASQFQWCSSSTGPTCNPVYYAFQALMTDIKGISNTPPQSYSSSTMPQVSSYTGYYPLATMNMVGATLGASVNSILHFAYQRTYGTTWTSVASPTAVNVTETIPTGMSVLGIKDLVTQSAVSYTTGSGTYTYAVADDPIEVALGPSPVFQCGAGYGSDYSWSAASSPASNGCGVSSSSLPTPNTNFVNSNGTSALTASSVQLVPADAGHDAWGLIYATAVNDQAFHTNFTFIPNGFFLTLCFNNAYSPLDGSWDFPWNFYAGAGSEGGCAQYAGASNEFPYNVWIMQWDGYQSLTPSGSFSYSSTQMYRAGQSPDQPPNNTGTYIPSPATTKISTSPVPLNNPATTQGSASTDTFNVDVYYNGNNVTQNLYDVTAGGTCTPVTSSTCFTYTWQRVNIPGIAGGPWTSFQYGTGVGGVNAWVELSAGTSLGTGPALQILNWSYYTLSFAATPSCSPGSGTYGSTQSVTCTDSSEGTIICTSTVGPPSTDNNGNCINGGTLYTGALSVPAGETLYAVAGSGTTSYGDSPPASYTYVITGSHPLVTFNPPAGTYSGNQSVYLSAQSGSIYYNTTGSPTCSSTAYTAPITVSSNETIYAVSCPGPSAVNSAAYVLNPFAGSGATAPANSPTLSPVGGTYSSAQTVTMTCSTPSTYTGVCGCYMVSTSRPTIPPEPDMGTAENPPNGSVSVPCACQSGTLYTSPFTVASSATVYATCGTTHTTTPSSLIAVPYTITGTATPTTVSGKTATSGKTNTQ